MHVPTLLVLAALVVAAAPTGAQAPAGPPEPPLFPRLFPHPSGQNGYEELLMAADLIRDCKPLDSAVGSDATLSAKRAALGELKAQRALALIRQGLAKPLRSPTTDPATSLENRFATFPRLRAIGRLLGVQQYVLLADGRVGEAVDTLRDSLRIAYTVQGEMVIGSLVGIAIDKMAMSVLARHLDQLSSRDCDRLLALAREWLSAPDPAISALATEREFAIRQLPDVPQRNGVAALFRLGFERMTADLRLPPWERKGVPVAPTSGDAATDELFKGMWETSSQAYAGINDAWSRDLAGIQLLGVHAAIRRYRWEHNRLPGSLDELKLDRLAIDPFSGKPFTYRVTGETTFDLFSEGPAARDDDGRPTGERQPIRW